MLTINVECPDKLISKHPAAWHIKYFRERPFDFIRGFLKFKLFRGSDFFGKKYPGPGKWYRNLCIMGKYYYYYYYYYYYHYY